MPPIMMGSVLCDGVEVVNSQEFVAVVVVDIVIKVGHDDVVVTAVVDIINVGHPRLTIAAVGDASERRLRLVMNINLRITTVGLQNSCDQRRCSRTK
jgi:hypothetical protein